MKKILSIIILLSLLCVSACVNKKELNITNSVNDELYRIKVLNMFGDQVGIQGGWFGQYIKDKFNVEIEYMKKDFVVTSEINLADYDLIALNGSGYVQAIEKGEVMSFEENDMLNSYGENIIKNLESNVDYNRRINQDNGLYGLCTVYVDENEPDVFEYTWNVRWDVYKEIGYPKVDDMDEYISVLKDMKSEMENNKNYEDIYAYYLYNNRDIYLMDNASQFVNAYFGYQNFGIGFYDAETKRFYGAIGNPYDNTEDSAYIESLRMLNKMYREGLLNEVTEKTTYEMQKVYLKEGKVIATLEDELAINYNEENMMSESVLEPLVPGDARVNNLKKGIDANGIMDRSYIAIGANCEHPERVMELLDFFATPEGAMTMMYGPKGIVWDYDANCNIICTEYGKKVLDSAVLASNEQMPEPYEGTFYEGRCKLPNLYNLESFNSDSNNERYYYKYWKSYEKDTGGDLKEDWINVTGCESRDEYMLKTNYVISPAIGFYNSDIDMNKNNVESMDEVSKIIIEGSWEAVYAKDDDEFSEVIENMINSANNSGYKECYDYYKEQAELMHE